MVHSLRDVRFRRALLPGWLEQGAHFIQSSLPRLAPHFRAIDESAELGEATVVERRPGMLASVTRHGDRTKLVYPGGMLEAPADLEPLLRQIARATRFSLAGLGDAWSLHARQMLVRRPLRDGLLQIADGGSVPP